MSELAFLAAIDLAAKIKAREISSRELLEYYLARVDRFNPDLNAIIVDQREQALRDADAADRALTSTTADLGPLHGVPMTVKESYNLAGTPTTWGNPDWKDNLAKEDAEPVRRLKQAGAIIFGKTNIPKMLADMQSFNDIYGTTNNPFDLSRSPGGSSGGSAAVLAAGLAGLEAGSDIGGSIRNPAHYCGVFGHKPTHNLLWMRGHSPPGDTRSKPDLSVIGPLARSARDLAPVLNRMAGPDDIMARGYQLKLPQFDSLKGKRVAIWADDTMCPVNRETRQRIENVADAIRDAGGQVNFEARPEFDSKQAHAVYMQLLTATTSTRIDDESFQAAVRRFEKMTPDAPGYAVAQAQIISFRDWHKANELRSQLRWRWHEFFQQFDYLIAPVMATAAIKHDHRPFNKRTVSVDGEQQAYGDQIFWSGLASASYLPSTVIPTGLNDAGLPIGVQIIGPEYGDLLTIGAAVELEAQGFAFLAPPNYTQ